MSSGRQIKRSRKELEGYSSFAIHRDGWSSSITTGFGLSPENVDEKKSTINKVELEVESWYRNNYTETIVEYL